MGFLKKSESAGSAQKQNKESGLFGSKSYLDVRALKGKVQSSPEEIRGVHYSKQKAAKAGLVEKMFSKEKFGSYVSKQEFEKRLKTFENKELPKISSYQEKEQAKKELEFLKRMSESSQAGSQAKQKTKVPFEGWFKRAA